MAIVDLVQRSDAWFAWRRMGITASMIPVIMGLSPYQTPYQLWAEFVGLKKPQDLSGNWHVQRGVEQEPEARETIEDEYGKPYMPCCVEADHNSLFKASLDGLYSMGSDKEVLEIKCPCEKIYNEILELKGKAPSFQMYAAQVQWQLNCSGANQGRLYFYLRGKRPINTGIKRNDAFIAQAEAAALHFWNLVQTKTAPDLIEGRDKEVYDLAQVDNQWAEKVIQYKEKAQYFSELDAKAKAVKADLKQLEGYFTEQIPADVQTFDKEGIRATRVERDGNVDYTKLMSLIESELNVVIPESLIESCRKDGSSYFRVTATNEDTQATKQNVSTEQSQPETVVTPKQEQTIAEPVEKPQPQAIAKVAVKQTEEKSEHIPLPPSNFFEKSTSPMFF